MPFIIGTVGAYATMSESMETFTIAMRPIRESH